MDSDTGDRAQLSTAIDAGTQMRTAREKAGLTLADVVSRTRVPLRHLEALERGAYGELPGITYCAGFARAYARAVGLDEKVLTAKVREEIDTTGEFSSDPFQIEEPTDPARVPPRFLAWTAAIIAMLIAGGYSVWRMQVNAPPSTEAPSAKTASADVERPAPVQRAARPAATPVAGPVVLTAVTDVWIKIYDADGKSLFQNNLQRGQSYTVPADAKGPMIVTGRPEALAVTVGGHAVPPLGTGQKTIADVPVSAAELLKRASPASLTAVPVSTAATSSGPAASGTLRSAADATSTSSTRKSAMSSEPAKPKVTDSKPSVPKASAPRSAPVSSVAAEASPGPAAAAPGSRAPVSIVAPAPSPPSGQ